MQSRLFEVMQPQNTHRLQSLPHFCLRNGFSVKNMDMPMDNLIKTVDKWGRI